MSVYNMLFPWQKEIVDKNKDRKRYGLFLDCGLGKTPTALAFAEANMSDKIMVVTINSKAVETEDVKGSFPWWAKHMPINYNIITKKDPINDSSKKKSKFISKTTKDFFMCNYESLSNRNECTDNKIVLSDRILEFLNSCIGNSLTIILDESHRVKSSTSLQTKCIQKIVKLAESAHIDLHLYLLSGTPFTVGYEDLFTQLQLLGLDWSKTKFLDSFCERGHLRSLAAWQQPIVGYKNVDQLFNIVHSYSITIKADSVIKLPEKIFIDVELPEPDMLKLFSRKKIRATTAADICSKRGYDIRNIWPVDYSKPTIPNPFYGNVAFPSEDYKADTAANNHLRARELSIGFQGNAEKYEWYDMSRLNKLEEFLKENPDNYILFYSFTPELMMLYDICDRLGYNIDVLCGDIKSTTFYDTYTAQDKNKQLSNTKNIMLVNYATGSTGKNFQSYHKTILFDVPLFKDYDQGIKRTSRIGQTQPTLYYRFYSNNFLDNGMLKAIDKGQEYTSDMFMQDLNDVLDIA